MVILSYMAIFREYKYTWWQIGVFKLALLTLGIAIGAYWADVFAPYIGVLIVLGLALGIYIAVISFKEQ